jgi:hypothetical protein
MIRCLLGMMLCLCAACCAFGQAAPYNPYAPQEEDAAPAVSADGKLNWPKFFKSAQLEARFQSYFAMGSCVGTKKSINDRLSANKVDVNSLPESKDGGVAVGVPTGAVTIAHPDGSKVAVVLHPAGVTKVTVTGPMYVGALRPGMTIRVLGKVDSRGVQKDVVDSIEVVTPTKELRVPDVSPDKLQTIVGTVVRLHDGHLSVKVPTGKLRRLNFTVDENTKVDVQGSDISLVGAGDHVDAFGHVYSGDSGNGVTMFASEVTVTKGGQGPAPTKP